MVFFVSFSCPAGGGNYVYKLLIEEAVLNSGLQHLVFSFLLYRLGHILAGPGVIPVTAALLISL